MVRVGWRTWPPAGSRALAGRSTPLSSATTASSGRRSLPGGLDCGSPDFETAVGTGGSGSGQPQEMEPSCPPRRTPAVPWQMTCSGVWSTSVAGRRGSDCWTLQGRTRASRRC